MIPYPELVAALERWRMRNGLPVSGGGVPSTYVPPPAAPTPSFTAPITAPPRPAPGAPPPAAAPVTAKVPLRAQTDEPLDLGDADVLDEDVLAPEGGDFAMAFGVSSSVAVSQATYDDDEVADEKTAIGNPGEPLSPFGPEAGSDTYDAEHEVLGEEDDPDPRRR